MKSNLFLALFFLQQPFINQQHEAARTVEESNAIDDSAAMREHC
jgi:hypothetical protein